MTLARGIVRARGLLRTRVELLGLYARSLHALHRLGDGVRALLPSLLAKGAHGRSPSLASCFEMVVGYTQVDLVAHSPRPVGPWSTFATLVRRRRPRGLVLLAGIEPATFPMSRERSCR